MEARILRHLQEILDELTSSKGAAIPRMSQEGYKQQLAAVRREQKAVEGQKSRLYDLLELGEYDLPTFRERMPVVKEKLARLEARRPSSWPPWSGISTAIPPPRPKRSPRCWDAYGDADIPQRNALLHSVIDYVTYTKEKKDEAHRLRPRTHTQTILMII